MKLTIASGDGIGPECMAIVLDVFAAAEIPVEVEEVPLDTGQPDGIGAAARASIERTGVLLRGPVATPLGRERFELGLRLGWRAFAEQRVYRMLPGVPTPLGVRELDLTLIRELAPAAGPAAARLGGDRVAPDGRRATRQGALRVHRHAFELAARMGKRRVTCAHLGDARSAAGGVFLDAFREVAAQHPAITADDLTVDRLALSLLGEPESFDVLVLPDMPGDIVSYLAAGLVGGLDYAPAATIGERVAAFGPLHEATPELAGCDLANPTALLLSATMMLRHTGLGTGAVVIERALERALFQLHRGADLMRHAPGFRTSVFRHLLLTELRYERRVVASLPRGSAGPDGLGVGTAADLDRSRAVLAEQIEGLA
jgi:isocitrate/isopropylmalate dehydrogenase